MTTNLQKYYNSILRYDLLLKLPVNNIFQIPKITTIHLNMGLKTAFVEKKKIISMLTLLKLILNQEPIVTKSKKNVILFKIKKNTIIGCKLTLPKKQQFKFLEKLLFLNIKPIPFTKINTNIVNFQITNNILLNIFELKTEVFDFQNLPSIDISLHTNTTTRSELNLFLNFLFFKMK